MHSPGPAPGRATLLLLLAIMAGCASGPREYPPPPQEPPLSGYEPARRLSDFVSMSDPNAEDYIVGGVSAQTESGTWRRAQSPAKLRFRVQPAEGQRFTLQFSIPKEALTQTGPVTLSVLVNGAPLGTIRAGQPVTYRFDQPVPSQLLRPGNENLVEITADPASEYQWFRAGFVE